MKYYCTLFDSNYLTRGLAMYESLKETTVSFHLYIVAFDELSYRLLTELQLESATIISLSEFEDEKLLTVKPTRTQQEYCWTCTPSVILYCIEKYRLDICTYIDADLYFYQDPSVLIEEMGHKSVLITLHRYTPQYDSSATSGKYCVQFMTFKTTSEGLNALNWWRDACLEWCYFKFEKGKFGDQKYLDDWLERFPGVHELEHLGGGVAPWNVQQYNIDITEQKLVIYSKILKDAYPLVFYHFHGVKFCKKNKVFLNTYELSSESIQFLYQPYIEHLERIKNQLNLRFHLPFNPHGKEIDPPYSIKTIIRFWVKSVILNGLLFVKTLLFLTLKSHIKSQNVISIRRPSI